MQICKSLFMPFESDEQKPIFLSPVNICRGEKRYLMGVHLLFLSVHEVNTDQNPSQADYKAVFSLFLTG